MAPCSALLRAACGLLLLRAAAAALAATKILAYRTPSAWFGSSAIALQAADDPVMLAATWVYPPTEILGFRPHLNSSSPAYADDTTRDLQYQTLYVASPGALPAPGAPPRIDALAFWNRKPHGTDGQCILLGYRSAVGPDLSLRSAAPGVAWHYNLSSDCNNINAAVPWARFALSDCGDLAVAWVQGAAGNLTLYALDGQSGALRWARPVPCGAPAQCQYFLAYGADVTSDGRFVVYDEGTVGDGSAHRLHVLNAADGSPRCAPLLSPGAIPVHLSPTGDFAFTATDASAPSSGEFATWQWSEAGGEYVRTPGAGRPPLDSQGNGWTLAQYAFAADAASGATLVGVVWVDSTLLGPSVAALYNASDPGAGPLSAAHTEPLPGSDMANAGAVIDCAGSVCAAGFYTQKVGGPQPTLVLLAADGGVFNYTTPGSVDSVSVAHAPGSGGGVYYVLATGCTSVGVCTEPGGDLVGLRVTLTG